MVFSSSLFLLYFLPIFFLIYFLVPEKIKNGVIFIGSSFFYMWGAPKFFFVIATSIVLDFILSKKIFYSTNERTKRNWLIVSIVANVSILLYFKYSNFFIQNVNSILQNLGYSSISWTSVALPIGISFFTFHELSYIIDVYRGVNKPMKRIGDYAIYILLFPQLIAGPIVRYKEIAHQIIERRKQETIDNRLNGLLRFIIGLSKKVLIANTLGAEVDRIFALPHNELSTMLSWFGIVAYSFQIYFDFSGYSDMAIGLARMMGFYFPENFNNPYTAKNITEFWRRWHMSLGRWMKDYLYIPLGGNKVKNQGRLFFNLWLVFLISGFWHGASWNFIIWGAFHGIFLIADRLFLINLTAKLGKFVSIIITYVIVLVGWVFFRTGNLTSALGFLNKMFIFSPQIIPVHFDNKVWFILCIAIVFSFAAAISKITLIQNRFYENKLGPVGLTLFSITCSVLFLMSLGSITSSGFNPFIYFRF